MKKVLVLGLFVSSMLCAQVPRSAHVVVVVEENHGFSSVIGNPAMPYLNSLASRYALATQYYANTHPSIGNYFMMTTGQIITNNDSFSSTINVNNLVRAFELAGKTWKSYAESLPSVGYTGGDVYPYTRHHNPFSYFSDVVNSSIERPNLVPFTHFSTDLGNGLLPDLSYVVPNKHDDGHDCPAGMSTCSDAQKLAAADNWLKAHIAPVFNSPEFQRDGVLIIVFDEAAESDTSHGGGRIAVVMAGPHVKRGYRSTAFYQHQSLLKTVLEMVGASSFPGAAASAHAMTDMFGTTTTTTSSGCSPAGTGVTVCSPASGSTDASPVHVAAAASSTHPITTMKIYVDNLQKYSVSSGSINTSLAIGSGTHNMVVQAWDSAGTVMKKAVQVTVP